MIRVRIPATTANLGPGYDCMGLALDLHNTFELHLDPDDYGLTSQTVITVESHGEGAATLPTDASNLVASVLLDELYNLNLTLPSKIHIVCHNTVPPPRDSAPVAPQPLPESCSPKPFANTG